MSPTLPVRTASAVDLPAVRDVALAAGQTGPASGADLRYLQHVLARGRMLVAVGADGALAGWGAVVATPSGELLSDLFVRPDQHGGGLGGAILSTMWPDPEAGGRYTFSSRHENALPLYLRTGLVPIWPLLYLTGERSRVPATDLLVRQVDAGTAAAADPSGGRAGDYGFWAAIGTPVVVERAGAPVGAGVLGPDEVLHLAGDDDRAVLAAIAAVESDAVSVCLPGPHRAVRELLRAGFRITDYDLAMATPDVRLAPTWAYSPGLA